MQLHNKNIEKAILSSIVYRPEVMDDLVYDLPSGEYFYDSNHRKIYQTMLQLHQNSEPIDEEFIEKYLQADTKFNQNSIVELMAVSPLVDTVAYIRELKELKFRRDVVSLSTKMFKIAKDEDKNKDIIENKIQQDLFEMISSEQSKGFLTAKEAISKTLNYIEVLKERGNKLLTGVDTGFYELNLKTAGFNKGDLIIIAARPAMGKTTIALNMVLKSIENSDGVVFFSLEMPAEQLMLRLLSAKTGIPLQNLRVGNIDDSQWEQVSDAMHEFENKTLLIDDNTNATIGSIRTRARRLKMQFPDIKLIVIDYLQLIQSASNKDRHLEVSEISRGLKTLAREIETPIIALSQLNRELEKRVNKRPMISDLRESGSIEQDADLILFVHREDVYQQIENQKRQREAKEKGIALTEEDSTMANVVPAELIIGKQRNGPIGIVELSFIKDITKFTDNINNQVAYQDNIQQTEAHIEGLDTSSMNMI
mgnify:FL=1